MVTHNLGVVADLCDRVAVMRNGTIVETRPTGDLFTDPEHEYTHTLLSSVLDATQPRAAYRPEAHTHAR
ncbi:ABC transporter ATP-binding protein [Yinghuangia aomiensis]